MVKYWKLLSAALALLLVLTGCASEQTPVTEPTTIQNSQETEAFVLGSKMPELTVTTAQDETLQISELLQQKKMVILNFWFAD